MKALNSSLRIASFVAVLASVAVAAGCGKDADETVAQAPGPAPAAQEAPPPAAVDPAEAAAAEKLQHYATAVESGKSSAPVDLKYDVLAKPAVGQPFELELAFVPRLPADKLEVEVTGIEGLTVVGDGRYVFGPVEAGGVYTAKVLAQADASGLYYFGVSAQMITPVQTEARAFSVPVVVGEVAATEKDAPEVDATGQAVQPMPAQESVEEKK
jgi:ABC-type transport system substrate-binding protein